MGVAVSVAGSVTVAVRDAVGVSEGVAVSEVSLSAPRGTRKKVSPAATRMIANNDPMAAGRLSVTCGRLAALTERSACLTALGWGCAPNSVPHTKQRTAFSLRRVPQVGHILVLLEFDSWVIGRGLYH